MDQIAFAEGTAGKELDSVDSAHIRFNDGHEIALARETQFLKGQFSRPYAYGQTRTRMAMKRNGFLDQVFADRATHDLILLITIDKAN
jgi:hypothetical protein